MRKYYNLQTTYFRFQVVFQIASVFLVQNYGMLFRNLSTSNVITQQMW